MSGSEKGNEIYRKLNYILALSEGLPRTVKILNSAKDLVLASKITCFDDMGSKYLVTHPIQALKEINEIGNNPYCDSNSNLLMMKGYYFKFENHLDKHPNIDSLLDAFLDAVKAEKKIYQEFLDDQARLS